MKKKSKRSRNQSAAPSRKKRKRPSTRPKRSRLRRIFADVLAYAKRKYPKLPRLALRIGCAEIQRARRAGNPRAFFHVGAHPGKVCTVAAAGDLDDSYLTALILHELGHLIAAKEWGRSDQIDADDAVRRFLGVKLHYRGPLLLEWISPLAVRRILRDCSPSSHLP